jgi:hypothetical protein
MLNSRRKGDPTDIVLFLVIIFFLAISLAVSLFANNTIQNLISTTALNSSEAYSSINSSFSDINRFVAQRGFTLMFGILIIGIIVSSFMVRVHPVFIFIYIITLAVAIFVAIYLANAYAMIVANPQLAELAENFGMMTFFMRNITKILLATGALSMIIIFGKIGGGDSSRGVDI